MGRSECGFGLFFGVSGLWVVIGCGAGCCRFLVVRLLCGILPFMNKEALLVELDRLLDLGEPLLDVFPKKYSDDWVLLLPENISYDMWWYAGDVAWRAGKREAYQDYRQRDSKVFLAGLVRDFEVGLLGWRAIGVLE